MTLIVAVWDSESSKEVCQVNQEWQVILATMAAERHNFKQLWPLSILMLRLIY